MSDTLVIALAWGYNLDVYKAFILSLRATARFSGDVSILAPANSTRAARLGRVTDARGRGQRGV